MIGGEATKFWHAKGYRVVSIDNDMRAYFFGKAASTKKRIDEEKAELKNLAQYKIMRILSQSKLGYEYIEQVFKGNAPI